MKRSRPSDLLPGIYAIMDGSGRFYIGSSTLPRRRWAQHSCELRKGRHHSPALQNVVNKHGLSYLHFLVLMNVPTSRLQEIEQACLDSLRPDLNGILQAGAGRMHRDPIYRSNLKAALAVANRRQEYRDNRRSGAAASMRAVRCLNDGRDFDSCSQAARTYKISSGSVSACAMGITLKTSSGLRFEFLDGTSPAPRQSAQRKTPVVCLGTGIMYPSIWMAAKAIGVTRNAIRHAIDNGSKCLGNNWREV